MEVRGQFAGVGYLLPLYGSQESNSSHQAWQQAPLPVSFLTGPLPYFLEDKVSLNLKINNCLSGLQDSPISVLLLAGVPGVH